MFNQLLAQFPARRTRLSLVILFILTVLANLIGIGKSTPALAADGTTYYVDCSMGSDTNSGASTTQAWKTLTRANKAPLQPGDSLLLQRGCTWTGPLKASWHGTAAQPITIGAYGSGDLPRIQNATSNVNITGSYLIVEYLQTRSDAPNRDPNCQNQGYGWTTGFNLTNHAAYNVVRHVLATQQTMGAHIHSTAHHNKILNSQFVGNTTMNTLTPTSVSSIDDNGPWGISIRGSDNEIARNYFSGNLGKCSYDLPAGTGHAMLISGARRTLIHHNRAINERTFTETSRSPEFVAQDNVWAYNLMVSNHRRGRFVVVHNSGSRVGPTYGSKLYNNTVMLTGAESQGVICDVGCSPDALVMRNNILWADYKAAFGAASFVEDHNLYWSSNGMPYVQYKNFTMSASSRVANPRFVDPANGDFHLKTGSPAIDTGAALSSDDPFSQDLGGELVPRDNATDIGAYEYTVATGGEEDPVEDPTIRNITFEDGRLVDPASGVARLTGAVTVEAATPISGAYSARIPDAADSYLDERFTPTDDLFVTFNLRLISLPAASVRIAFISNDGLVVGALHLDRYGALQLRNKSTVVGAPTSALQVGRHYQIGLRQKRSSGAEGVLEAYLRELTGVFGAPFASMNDGNWTTPADRVRLGATTSTQLNAILDDIRLSRDSW